MCTEVLLVIYRWFLLLSFPHCPSWWTLSSCFLFASANHDINQRHFFIVIQPLRKKAEHCSVKRNQIMEFINLTEIERGQDASLLNQSSIIIFSKFPEPKLDLITAKKIIFPFRTGPQFGTYFHNSSKTKHLAMGRILNSVAYTVLSTSSIVDTFIIIISSYLF